MGILRNGVSNARVVIKRKIDGTEVFTHDLPLTNSKGQLEDYDEQFTRHETIDGELVDFDFRGCRITWTLHFDELIVGDTLDKLESIWYYHSQPQLYYLVLYPRVDELRRFFEVRLLTGNYRLGNKKGKSKAVGHREPIIGFITTHYVAKNFQDPSTQPILGSPNSTVVIIIKNP